MTFKTSNLICHSTKRKGPADIPNQMESTQLLNVFKLPRSSCLKTAKEPAMPVTPIVHIYTVCLWYICALHILYERVVVNTTFDAIWLRCDCLKWSLNYVCIINDDINCWQLVQKKSGYVTCTYK